MILQSFTEEQRLLVLQELQSLAQQGETQAASALSSLMGDMTNAVDGSNQVIVAFYCVNRLIFAFQ